VFWGLRGGRSTQASSKVGTEADSGGMRHAEEPRGRRDAWPRRSSTAPTACQPRTHPRASSAAGAGPQAGIRRVGRYPLNNTPHLNHDRWYGHDRAKVKRYQLDHPYNTDVSSTLAFCIATTSSAVIPTRIVFGYLAGIFLRSRRGTGP